MKLHRVHSLDSSQIRQLQTMVNKCTDSDGTRLSFPFDEADLFLYFEHDGSIVSAIALTILPELLRACSMNALPSRIRSFAVMDSFLGFWMRESMNFRKIRS